MGLPKVELPFQNGNLALVEGTEDGIFGLVVSADDNPSLTIGEVYSVKTLADCTALGILDTVENHFFYKFLTDFYAAAGEGNKLWIFPIARTELMSDQFKPGVSGIEPVRKMCDAANGEISLIFTCWNPDNTVTLTTEDGVDEDVWETITAAQTFCTNYTTAKAAPVSVITEGYNYNGTDDLVTLQEMTNNRVAVVIGNTEKRSGLTSAKGASLGKLAGRLAVNKVSTNAGRKKSGPLYDETVYIVDTPVELFDVEMLHDLGFITFRMHLKSSGYYITDTPMACDPTDDYGNLTRRRTIDKAYRLGFVQVNEELLEDFPLTSSGTIDPIYAKQIEQNVISSIYTNMALNGELSVDPTNTTDKGCVCKIDLTYPTGTTNKIKFIAFQVKPKGYANLIEVPIGFVPFNAN